MGSNLLFNILGTALRRRRNSKKQILLLGLMLIGVLIGFCWSLLVGALIYQLVSEVGFSLLAGILIAVMVYLSLAAWSTSGGQAVPPARD